MASYAGFRISENEAIALGAIVIGGALVASKFTEISSSFGSGFAGAITGGVLNQPKSTTTSGAGTVFTSPDSSGFAPDLLAGINAGIGNALPFLKLRWF